MARHKSRKAEPELGLFPERPPPADDSVNREPRVTGTFLIDITSSLSNVIAAYVAALTALYDACRGHPNTRSSAFVSTTLCGGGEHTPGPYLPFAAAELPAFQLVGGSPGGRWLREAVAHLRAEHARMKAAGVPSNKDVFLLVSDFHWDDPHAFDGAIEAYRTLEAEFPQMNGFMVMCGSNPNRELAGRISKKRAPVHLDELHVDEMFRWVSTVLQRASMSRPGQSVDLPAPTWTLSDGKRD